MESLQDPLVLGLAGWLVLTTLILWKTIRQAKARSAEYQGQLADAEARVDSTSSKVEQLESQLQRTKTRADIAESAVDELKSRFSKVLDVERERERIEEAQRRLSAKLRDMESERSQLGTQVTLLKAELADLDESLELRSNGYYEPRYEFDSAGKYKDELDRNKGEQKSMIKRKLAATCSVEWAVDGNKRKGQKQADDLMKLMLRAFNGECDAAIAKVTYKNISTMENRLDRAYEAINKLGSVMSASITDRYRVLRLRELYLVHEYQERLQEEKEEQRRIKEQIREEEQAEKEIAKALREAEKEEARYAEALRKAREDVEKTEGAKRSKLEEKLRALEEKLAEAQANKEKATSMAQLTRSGHVYIISNVGSFGEDVFKIGMTRRLEPNDRIRELSNASVPFPFDIHAMIYSEDAPALETALHHAFTSHRVNRINKRKEFFKVSLEAIEAEARKQGVSFRLTKLAEAKEFRMTIAEMGSKDEGKSGATEAPEVKSSPETNTFSTSYA